MLCECRYEIIQIEETQGTSLIICNSFTSVPVSCRILQAMTGKLPNLIISLPWNILRTYGVIWYIWSRSLGTRWQHSLTFRPAGRTHNHIALYYTNLSDIPFQLPPPSLPSRPAGHLTTLQYILWIFRLCDLGYVAALPTSRMLQWPKCISI
jgi:hypothetical protein